MVRNPTVLILVLSLVLATSFSGATQNPPAPTEAVLTCQQKKGVLVYQGTKAACFDPMKGVVNGGFSTMPGHELIEEKEDLDLITGKNIKFYRTFEELNALTVCNFSRQEIVVAWHKMNFISPPPVSEHIFASGVCRTRETHMFAIYPDRKSGQSFLNLIAKPKESNSFSIEKPRQDKGGTR